MRVLGISVNIPIPKHPILPYVFCSLWWFYRYFWSYIGLYMGWVWISTWRRSALAYSVTGDPLFLVQNMCDSSPFNHQSILMKDHLMGTLNIVWILFYFSKRVAVILVDLHAPRITYCLPFIDNYTISNMQTSLTSPLGSDICFLDIVFIVSGSSNQADFLNGFPGPSKIRHLSDWVVRVI